jgi:hypothetical protein
MPPLEHPIEMRTRGTDSLDILRQVAIFLRSQRAELLNRRVLEAAEALLAIDAIKLRSREFSAVLCVSVRPSGRRRKTIKRAPSDADGEGTTFEDLRWSLLGTTPNAAKRTIHFESFSPLHRCAVRWGEHLPAVLSRTFSVSEVDLLHFRHRPRVF